MKKRRVALYFAWSRPQEIRVDLGVLENRYPTLFEFRRALYPLVEALKEPKQFSQDISGFLDHVILDDFRRFTKVISEQTGVAPPVVQREGDEPPAKQLDRDFLVDYDTLIIVSLDHFRTRQSASQAEIEAIRDFLQREDRCVFVCPHHQIGAVETPTAQQEEFTHHGDRLVPAQQIIGGFARSLLIGLGAPVENRFGLSPSVELDGSPSPLLINSDLDQDNLLRDVRTFNAHPHLPHLHFEPTQSGSAAVLALQPVNPRASAHPFVTAGNHSFNALLRLSWPQWSGRLYVCDATLWSSAFHGVQSLTNFWRNIATMPLGK
jgi:hypothetical protein